MKTRRSKLGNWSWILLAIVLLALAGVTGATIAAAKAGEFPSFIPMPGVSARGVAVDKVGNVYVSMSVIGLTGEVIQVQKFTPDGKPLFSVPISIGHGTIGGLMVSANGDLFIALAAGHDKGVYRMEPDGETELLPGSNQIFFANGLAFDDVGNLYITESVTLVTTGPSGPGSIWRIPRGGEAELWMRDEVLRGTGSLGQPVYFGANGIVYYHGDLFVTNSEKGTLLRIPVEKDGSAGTPEVWPLKEVYESPFVGTSIPMGDGLALDVHGNLYVAVITRCAVVRVNPLDKSQETVAVFRIPDTLPLYAKLDFPASLFFGTGKGERTNLFVTNQGIGASIAPGLPWAGPGLVKIDAGVAGQPLH